MNHAEYEAIKAANWSTVKVLWKGTPLHYKHALDNPTPSTDAQVKGQLLHTLVLEPEKMAESYAIWTGGQRRGKEWTDFQAANAGKTIIREQDIAEVQAQAAAVRAHPVAMRWIESSKREMTIVWTDPKTDMPCKGRLDLWNPAQSTLLDLKGCGSTDPRLFAKEMAKNGYHCQLAHYGEAVRALTGNRPAKTLIIAVETEAPYDVAIFRVPEEALDFGRLEVAGCLEILRQCRDTGEYPGSPHTETMLDLPAWAYNDGDVTVSFGEG